MVIYGMHPALYAVDMYERKPTATVSGEKHSMTLHATQRPLNSRLLRQAHTTDSWKKTISEILQSLKIIPENFNGKVVVSFKDGGVSYLEKSETFK